MENFEYIYLTQNSISAIVGVCCWNAFCITSQKVKNELIFRGKSCIIRVNSNILIAKRLEMIVVKSCKEIAIEWEVPIRTVNDWCKKGKIPGAIKVGRDWQIPKDAEELILQF